MGEEKAYLGKTGPQSGHGPKGQSPIHVKVAGGVCVGRGGSAWDCQRGLLKAGVYLRQWNEKEWTTKLVILQIRPITSSLFPFRAGGGYGRKVGSGHSGMRSAGRANEK